MAKVLPECWIEPNLDLTFLAETRFVEALLSLPDLDMDEVD